MSPNMRGAVFMSASMAGFMLNDALMKLVSAEMDLFQAIFLRGIASTILMVLMAVAMGMFRVRMPRRDRLVILLRSLAEIAATYFYLNALFNMPIANASAILQALPLTVTLAGAIFFGEAVGWRRMSAILVGFIGVILIVRPGAEGFSAYSLYAVAAVVMVTVRDLAARAVSIETPSMMVAIAGSLGVFLFAAVGVAGSEWQPVSGRAAVAILGAAVMIIGGYLFSILTMRVGEIAVVAPFRYTSLLWALLLGFVVFGEWPDRVTLLGAAVVVGTGIFTFRRERRLAAQLATEHRLRQMRQGSVDIAGDSH